jgi:hypothetical protein
MGGRLMKQQLQEISNKSHAETIDLWPEIYAALKETKAMKHPPRMSFVLSRVAAIFILFFLGAAVVYAVSQIYVDSGLEGERAERLITQVNESITHGDITIRFDWAYADENRISVGYTFLDAEGNVFVPERAKYSYEFGLYMRPMVEAEARGYRPTITLINRTSMYDLSSEQQISTWIPFFFYEMAEYSILEDDSVELDLRINLRGVPELYRFLVEIPVYPAQFEVEEILIHDADFDIVLHDLTVTPTMTSAFFCYTIPDEFLNQDIHWLNNWTSWESTISLYFDNENVSAIYPQIGRQFSSWRIDESEFCSSKNWAIPSDILPQRVRFVVHELRESSNGDYTEEQAQFLVEQYELRGIEVVSEAYAPTSTYGVWPVGLYETDAYTMETIEKQTIYDEVMRLFYAEFTEIPQIIGPWEIEFELNEASS